MTRAGAVESASRAPLDAGSFRNEWTMPLAPAPEVEMGIADALGRLRLVVG